MKTFVIATVFAAVMGISLVSCSSKETKAEEPALTPATPSAAAEPTPAPSEPAPEPSNLGASSTGRQH